MNEENMKPFFPVRDHILHEPRGKLQSTIVQESSSIVVGKWGNVDNNWSYFSLFFVLDIDYAITCTEGIEIAQGTVVQFWLASFSKGFNIFSS